VAAAPERAARPGRPGGPGTRSAPRPVLFIAPLARPLVAQAQAQAAGWPGRLICAARSPALEHVVLRADRHKRPIPREISHCCPACINRHASARVPRRGPRAPGRSPCRAPPHRAPAWTCTPARRTCARAAVGVGSPRAWRCGEPARGSRGRPAAPRAPGPHLLNGRPSARPSPASPGRSAPQPVYLYRTRSCCMLPKHTCTPGPGLSSRSQLLLLHARRGCAGTQVGQASTR